MRTREWIEQWPKVSVGKLATVMHNVQMVRGYGARFGVRSIDGGVSPLEASVWAQQNPGAVRYVRLMYRDAVAAGVAASNPFEAVRVGRAGGRVDVSPPSEQVLLATCAQAPGVLGDWGRVFGAMALCAAYSGLRLNEIARLEARDVSRLPDTRLFVRYPKGGEGRERTVGVFGPGERALLEVMPEVGLVFPSPRGRVLTRDTVSRRWGELRGVTGTDCGNWHQLRHFCATWLLDHGASVLDVALQLGHTDNGRLVQMTYGHPSESEAVSRLRRLVG